MTIKININMPVRNIYFTFNTKVKINKETVSEFKKFYEYYLEYNKEDIKEAFGTDSIDVNFIKEFIRELKTFDSVSDDDGTLDKKEIIKGFIRG